ncbi:carboxymuconolactone decarboxylase family protein [Chitinibacter tainanensis]|uniref:carboxymuconolactone decarboxylase family protein n=1 Tax=Chitinibacter tainanensis TaxID=230667 RepID=UPI000429224D|nr:carboxymuconolactone decarboxylase family protein [Chitinibacter tainanensis]
MTPFQLHTIATAPAGSQSLLQAAQTNYGFVPNLFAHMAESPALLEGYLALTQIFNHTNLSETEKQIIMMTANRLNRCDYCMAAHTTIAKAAVPAEVIAALRNNTPIADAKLEALRQFTSQVVESRGWPTAQEVASFIAAGYSQQTVFEVILGTSLKILSNYTTSVADTPLDAVFAADRWPSA